jgi:CDP-glucose 4,6-dehydratase
MVMKGDDKSFYRGKTVLVTGDTGFKGSWLSLWLVHRGARVIGYSLPPKTADDNYNICALAEKITHINGDVKDHRALRDAFSRYEPDIVFHLAAQALVLDSYKDPLNTFETNTMGTANVLEAIRHTPSVKAVVVVTSDKCYDNKEWIYGYRETDPLGGVDPYSASKGACEIVAASYIRSFFSGENTASVATVRAGNVLGGGDWCTNRIVPDCIRALRDKKPIVIRNPDAVRPWQHVLEPLSGYMMLGAALYSHGKSYSGPWNFGPLARNMIPVRQLVEEIISQWGSGNYVCERPPDSYHESNMLHLDISKAINKLSWYPVLDFRQTIQFVVREYAVDNRTAEEVFDQRISHIEAYEQLKQKQNR